MLIWSLSPALLNEQTPIVIVLHGLEASFDSFYAKRMMNAIHQKGWVGLLMQFRGCGKKQNRLAKTYHSGQTEDVAELVKYVHKKFPNNPKYSVGFSLGGNMLAKYLGEESSHSVLSGGIVISAPIDLSICAHAIGQGFSAVYQKYLVDKIRNKNKEKGKTERSNQSNDRTNKANTDGENGRAPCRERVKIEGAGRTTKEK